MVPSLQVSLKIMKMMKVINFADGNDGDVDAYEAALVDDGKRAASVLGVGPSPLRAHKRGVSGEMARRGKMRLLGVGR